jgi:uncharacterized protein (TIGR02301 family)
MALAALIVWPFSAALGQQAGSPAPDPAAAPPVAPTLLPDEPAAFDGDLARLSTILGSLHYLRNLCGETGNQWRDEMDGILRDGALDGERRRRMISAFNNGYRSFSTTYTSCSARAAQAGERFRLEGAALAAQIATRFRG